MGGAHILIQTESTETAEILLFRAPHSIDDILDVDDIVGLAVAGVAEGHVRRVGLGDGR